MINKEKMKAMKYIKKEYDLLQNDPILSLGCTVGLPDKKDIFRWKISLVGPTDTPYAGGMFFLYVEFTEDYPDEAAEH